ncbi:hypothetical protein DVH26_28130 [Paenibacillus sp. H1-7]|nr:hypothetical protein DVH26_28130 [Paenibacillus sp. H1-7]
MRRGEPVKERVLGQSSFWHKNPFFHRLRVIGRLIYLVITRIMQQQDFKADYPGKALIELLLVGPADSSS